MAEGKKTFIFYSDWINMVREMPNEDAGQLLKHVLSYVNDENPNTDNLLVKMAFGHMKPMLKADLDKWEKIREKRKKAGAKGGKQTQANAKQMLQVAKQVQAVNDNVNVNVYNIDDDVENKILKMFDNFIKEIKEGKHSMAIEQIYMRLKVRKGTLQKVLEDYKGQIIIDKKVHRSTQEMLSHFNNYCNTQDRIGKLDEFKNVKRAGSL